MAKRKTRTRLSYSSLRLSLGGLALLLLIAAVVIPAMQADHLATARSFVESSLMNQAESRRLALSKTIRRFSTDLQFLAATPPIHGIIRATNNQGFDAQENSSLQDWQRRLEYIFSSYARAHPNVTQVRFIGLADNGRELVRVDRTDQGILAVRGPALQSKAHRDYFQETVLRGPGGIYVSDINLNREHGKVSEPHTPTIRLAIPVFDGDQHTHGIVIINLRFDQELLKLSQDSGEVGTVMLLNSTGDYLLHPDRKRTFGFDLGTPYRWQDDYAPAEPLSQVQANRMNAFRSHSGEILHVVQQKIQLDQLDHTRDLSIVLAVPDELFTDQAASARRSALLLLLPVGLLISGFLFLLNLAIRRGEEASLNQAELAAIVDSSGDAIIGVDLQGCIQSWNKAAESMFLYPADEAIGQSMASLLSPDHADDEMSSLLSNVRKGETTPAFDTVRCRKDGSQVDVSITTSPIRSVDGEVAGMALIARDITEHKLAETRILRMNATLEQKVTDRTKELVAAKTLADEANAAKSEFLANMSHEIRTPMNAVQGMLQLLERTPLNDQQFDYVEKAGSAGASLLHIIDEILDYSKIEAGKLTLNSEAFGVSQLLKDVAVVASGNVSSKPVELLFDVDPAVPHRLIGDEHRLRQILINLLGNAVKFTSEGEVLLKLELLQREGSQASVRFSVRDTGIGMSQEQQERIFQAFVQADAGTTRRYGGTGLGLVICQRLIQMMDGHLQVNSTHGEGSEFFFTLNLPVASENTAQQEQRQHRHATLQALKTLSVDDNELALQISQNMLLALNWQADIAHSGPQALRQVEQANTSGQPYDVIFLDWRMPQMDGWETARRIRAACQDGPQPLIILVSAYTREAYANFDEEQKGQVNRMLMKPLTQSDVFDAVVSCQAELRGQKTEKRQARQGERLRDVQILVAEDNATNQQVASELLGSEGAKVSLAENGRIALDMLRQQRFDIVLMDIQMPEMDGLTATRHIREELKLNLPVLAMTANVLPRDLEQSKAAGMDGHIGKPFDFSKLVSTILEHLGDDQTLQDAAVEPATQDSADFDFKRAIDRLASRQDLFSRQARQFATAPPLQVARLRQQLKLGEIEEACRALHSLKGVAGTLGALALYRYSRQLEAKLSTPGSEDNWEDLLDHLERLLQEACKALLKKAEEIDRAADRPDTDTSQHQDAGKLLEELEQLLSRSNMRALEVFDALRNCAGIFPPAIADTLDASLQALDFPAALVTVRDLIQQRGHQ